MSNTISQQKQDPNVYAQQYANQNGISLDEAKSTLKSQYGDPQKNGSNSIFDSTNSSSSNTDEKKSSINDKEFAVESNFSIQGMFKNIANTLQGKKNSNNSQTTSNSNNTKNTASSASNKPDPSVDPDTYAQQYANENGLTLDEAKTELQSKYGEPQKPDKNESNKSTGYANASSTTNKTGNSTSDKPDPSVDPDTYAQQYANENGLTLDEAKAELQSKYGEPQKPDKNGSNKSTGYANASNTTNKTGNSTSDKPDPSVDPDTYAQQYANENGLTLDEAKAELKSKYGDPQKPDKAANTANNTNKPDASIDPDTYAQQYADENGITLDAAKEILQSMYSKPVKPNLFS